MIIDGRLVDPVDQPLTGVVITILTKMGVVRSGDATSGSDDSRIIRRFDADEHWEPIGKAQTDEAGRFRQKISRRGEGSLRHVAVGKLREGNTARDGSWLIVASFTVDGRQDEIVMGTIKLDKSAMDWIAESQEP